MRLERVLQDGVCARMLLCTTRMSTYNWTYNRAVTLEMVTVDRVVLLMMPMIASAIRAGHSGTGELTKTWKGEGVRPVLDMWLH